jgi:hypothetical protein
MANLKLVIMLIVVGLMVGCVSGIVFEKNAPNGETKIVSGVVTDIRFTSTIYSFNSATYMIIFEGGHWFIVGGSDDYGVDATVQQDVVTQIQLHHNYHMHFEKKGSRWELVQVEEVKTLG